MLKSSALFALNVRKQPNIIAFGMAEASGTLGSNGFLTPQILSPGQTLLVRCLTRYVFAAEKLLETPGKAAEAGNFSLCCLVGWKQFSPYPLLIFLLIRLSFGPGQAAGAIDPVSQHDWYAQKIDHRNHKKRKPNVDFV